MLNIGDLVRINHHHYNPSLIGKMAVVVHKGTWSADILVIDCGYETRLGIDNLEVLC